MGCKSVVKDNVPKTVEKVDKRQKGILFFRLVNGEFGWFETGDDKKDSKYVGEIEFGKPNGQGTFTYPDGKKFVGKYKDGKPNGLGIFTFPDGKKYVGEWKDTEMCNVKDITTKMETYLNLF